MAKMIKKSDEINENYKNLAKMFSEVGLKDFVRYLNSPKKLFWRNFYAGVAKGLGIVVGMTVVVAILVWVLSQLVNFPLIGDYFLEIKNLLESMSPVINYK